MPPRRARVPRRRRALLHRLARRRLADRAPLDELAIRGFAFELEARVPVSPEAAFDAFTGDVTPWWDHTFSEHPLRTAAEWPRPARQRRGAAGIVAPLWARLTGAKRRSSSPVG